MNRLVYAAAAAALLLGAAACGSTYGDSSPTGPTDPSTPAASGAATIDIVGERGSLSFSPNPASVPAGQMVVWHNRDSETHRVVLDRGGLDTGNIPAGGFSAPMMLGTSGGYHCSIHPSMTGSLTGGMQGATIDPPTAPPGDSPAY